MTPSWVVWLTHVRDGMPSRGIWTSWRSGPVWTSWGSTRPSARSCTWVGETPVINTVWGMKGLRAALQRRTWSYWWMKCLTCATYVPSQARRPTISWAASKEAQQQVEGEDSFPLLHSGETSCGVLVSSSGTQSSTGWTQTCWSRSREKPQKWSKGWMICPVRKGWESWGCSGWSRGACGDTLLRPSSTCRGPVGKTGKLFAAGPVVTGWGAMSLK